MEALGYIAQVFQPVNLLWMTIAAIVGVGLGALPGMSADTGIAIFLPVTANMEPVTGLITLGTIYVTGCYGGNITAILIKTPGTSDSLFMVFDGYPMTVRGKGARAIGISSVSAFCGGVIGALSLLFIAPSLAQIALAFGPTELFLTTMLGICIIVAISKASMLKGLLSAAIGFMCALIGTDAFTGAPRFNFGITQIYDELPLLPTVLGLFAVSQIMILIAENKATVAVDDDAMAGSSAFISFRDIGRMSINIIRSGIIGTIVGIIPAAGSTIACGISYNIAKSTDKHPEEYGTTGSENGLAAVSAANNAVVGGSLVPLLTLSIPGCGTAALFLGGLLVHGLAPGVKLFTDYANVRSARLWGILIANVWILIAGLFGAKYYAKLTKVSTSVLIPMIGLLSILGSYCMRYLTFDGFIMIFFGIVGYYMDRIGLPLGPFVLSFVLGKTVESNLRRTLMVVDTAGLEGTFLQPIALLLLACNILILLWPFFGDIKKKLGIGKNKKNDSTPTPEV